MQRTRNLREGADNSNNVIGQPDKITPPQRDFILGLLDKREVEGGRADEITKMMRISEDPEELGCTKRGASKIIDELKALPWKRQEPQLPTQTKLDAILPDVPAGHYAVTGDDGTTDFYRVDRPQSGKWAGYTFVKLQLSDYYERIPMKNMQTILNKIVEAGVRESAIRYGMELGRCSICNRTLTNPESIEAGIGPVCAGRRGWWD